MEIKLELSLQVNPIHELATWKIAWTTEKWNHIEDLWQWKTIDAVQYTYATSGSKWVYSKPKKKEKKKNVSAIQSAKKLTFGKKRNPFINVRRVQNRR